MDEPTKELLRAARRVLAYRYCMVDGAGRKETTDGMARAVEDLATVVKNVENRKEPANA